MPAAIGGGVDRDRAVGRARPAPRRPVRCGASDRSEVPGVLAVAADLLLEECFGEP